MRFLIIFFVDLMTLILQIIIKITYYFLFYNYEIYIYFFVVIFVIKMTLFFIHVYIRLPNDIYIYMMFTNLKIQFILKNKKGIE